MKFVVKAVFVGSLVMAGVAFAQDQAAREDLMKANGAAAKVLGDMAKGTTAYDAAAAEAAKAKLIEDAGLIPTVFEAPATEAETESKPEIWTNWDDFVVKANALKTASEALDVSSAETIGAGMAGIGGACADCHKAYRVAN